MTSERLFVPSLHCSSCEDHLKSVLSSVPRFRDVSTNVPQHTVTFTIDPGDTDDNNTSSLSRNSLVRNVQRVLNASGYASYRDHQRAGGLFRRLTNAVLGHERRLHERHLTHCAACQEAPSQHEEKDDGASLTTVQVDSRAPPKVVETRIAIEGMTCSACSTAITRHVQQLPGVSEIEVNLVLNSAVVKHVPDTLPIEKLVDEIEDVGYGATLISSVQLGQPSPLQRTLFGIEGMTCSSCSGTIHAVVSEIEGVKSVSVSLIGNSMEVVHNRDVASESVIMETVSDCGYSAEIWNKEDIKSAEIQKEAPGVRTVQLLIEGFGELGPAVINDHLESLDLVSFTRVQKPKDICTISYVPSPELTIRDLLQFPDPVRASLYTPPSLTSRSREMQMRETKHITKIFIISFIIAIPTFIIGVVGMSLLPKTNHFRTWCEQPIWGGAMRSVIALWILATVVQTYVNRVFYIRAWRGVASHRGPWRWSRLIHFGNMDLLVALSTTAAYGASLGMMARDVARGSMSVMETGSNTYFDSCVFLAFFILMGRVLEGRAKIKTGDAIGLLGSMRPENALLIPDRLKSEKAGEEEFDTVVPTSIPAEHIELGDYLLIQPGAVPPADGDIVHGTTTFDESSLTGEFMPVQKAPGDAIMTGTINLTAPVVIRVNNVGEETMLQKIVHAVAEGQNRKAPIERLADKITSVFIPIVVYLSLAVLAIWLGLSLGHAIPDSYLPGGRTSAGDRVFFAFEFAISCLVIACPCGIGLAAPTAQAVGAGMAAKAGILAQGGGEAFQSAAKVDTVVFDKTGTLTLGEAIVADVLIAEKVPLWVFAAVRMMEGGSSHPLALAISDYCSRTYGDRTEGVRILHSDEVSGRGVRATISVDGQNGSSISKILFVGNEAFILEDNHATLPAQLLTPQVQKWRESGHSVVLVAVGDTDGDDVSCQVQGFLAIADTIRPESAQTVARLQASGREVFMLTGDNEITARAVAHRLGIDAEHVKAGVLPQEKAEFIAKLQDRSIEQRHWWSSRSTEHRSIVAFCGDGLNDSAALARADVGVALAHGSQVTISAASFVLLSKSNIPSSLLTLLNISRRVFNRQKMNFGWAMVYNIALVPIAAGVLYPHNHTKLPPVWSALSMALSSVSVVVSSLALQWGL